MRKARKKTHSKQPIIDNWGHYARTCLKKEKKKTEDKQRRRQTKRKGLGEEEWGTYSLENLCRSFRALRACQDETVLFIGRVMWNATTKETHRNAASFLAIVGGDWGSSTGIAFLRGRKEGMWWKKRRTEVWESWSKSFMGLALWMG